MFEIDCLDFFDCFFRVFSIVWTFVVSVKTTEWFTCMERSCSLFDEWNVLVWCRGHSGRTASSGRYTNTGWRSSDPGTDWGVGVDCCRVFKFERNGFV